MAAHNLVHVPAVVAAHTPGEVGPLCDHLSNGVVQDFQECGRASPCASLEKEGRSFGSDFRPLSRVSPAAGATYCVYNMKGNLKPKTSVCCSSASGVLRVQCNDYVEKQTSCSTMVSHKAYETIAHELPREKDGR